MKKILFLTAFIVFNLGFSNSTQVNWSDFIFMKINEQKEKENKKNEEIYGSTLCAETIKTLDQYYHSKERGTINDTYVINERRIKELNNELVLSGWDKSFDEEENLWLYYKRNCKKLNRSFLRKNYATSRFSLAKKLEKIGMVVD